MSDPCQECCEALDCRVTAIETNVDELFSRTDQLKAAIEGGYVITVTTEQELDSALALSAASPGGKAIILNGPMPGGVIQISNTKNIKSNTKILFGGLYFPWTAGGNHIACNIQGSKISFHRVKFDMGHPCSVVGLPGTASLWSKDTCMVIAADIDCSYLSITECEFVNFFYGIRREIIVSGGIISATNLYSDYCKIDKTIFRHFCGLAVGIRSRMRCMSITNSVFSGWDVDDSTPHNTDTMAYDVDSWGGNALFIANQSELLRFEGNVVKQVDRHGIEYWNSQGAPFGALTNGNKSAHIHSNSFYQIRSFAISAFGSGTSTEITDNDIFDVCAIGIETYQDPVNDSIVKCNDNTIDRIIQLRTTSPVTGAPIANGIPNVAISINGVQRGEYRGNYIGLVKFDLPGFTTDPVGIQLISPIPSRGCRGIVIDGNTFEMSGTHMILINSNDITTFYNITISNNVFKAPSTYLRPGVGFATAIWAIKAIVVIKDNIIFAKTASLVAGNPFYNNGDSTIYSGQAADAATVLTGPHNVAQTAVGNIWGSNLLVTHS